ncbi:hypothetical protein [Thermocrispum municipale]|uniref:hypothetical protein n=1 Tax=Thermocrispum municipale TaxID=37926 RepID=UPI00041F6C37|nr:hypothetical protein [Thermocrispum municipale]
MKRALRLLRAAGRWLRRRWLALALVIGVGYTVVAFAVPMLFATEKARVPLTPEAKLAIPALRESSVYVQRSDDAAWELDVQAARKVIGDRPLLIAGFTDPKAFDPERAPYPEMIARDDKAYAAEHGDSNPLKEYDVPMGRTCEAIAAEYPDTMVVVIHPRPNFARACVGPDFPRDKYDDEPPHWPEGVLASAMVDTRPHVEAGRLLPMVEELVPNYEERIAFFEDPPGERDLGGPYRELRISGYVVGGAVAAALLFLLLRRGFGTASQRADERRERAGARAAAQADVNALADRVLALERDQARVLVGGEQPPDPDQVVTLAEGYLHLVRDFDAAESTEEYRAISRRAEDLLRRAPD